MHWLIDRERGSAAREGSARRNLCEIGGTTLRSVDTVAAATLQCAWQSPSHLPVAYRTRRCSDDTPLVVSTHHMVYHRLPRWVRSALQRVAHPSHYQPPQPPLPRWVRSALQRHRLIRILRIISLLTRPSRQPLATALAARRAR